ncbi:MAG TPA: amino acid adenylation domain-containing protein, partial [Vicinamibacteria bacterium]
MSFRALDERASRLARHLQTMGVGCEDRVALLLERGLDFVVGLLAAVKAGGAYVPLDPSHPRGRLARMIADSSPAVVLTTSALLDRLEGADWPVFRMDADGERVQGQADERIESRAAPENLVYLMFTSGSTGSAKAVAVEHRQLANYITGIGEALALTPGEHFGFISTVAADLGHTALFPSLCLGGCLHVIARERAFDGAALSEYLDRHPIDCLKIVPTHLEALRAFSGGGRLAPRRRLVLGGEACRRELLHAIQSSAPECAIFNHYGPTETTVGVLTGKLRPQKEEPASGSIPLGRPLANTRIYLLDPRSNPVPSGVPGELCAGGASPARGYFGKPEPTAEKFLPDPFAPLPGARLYRTGDLCRFTPDGEILFLGRSDHQLKIRGHRVELGEIEAVLREVPGVKHCAVAAREYSVGDVRLAAYLVPENPASVRLAARAHRRLPNGLVVADLNQHETAYQYEEIFEEETYLRHGIALEDGDCVFDVGANIGLATLFFHSRQRNLRIYALEPVPALFEILKLNTELYGIDAVVLPLGLSASRREASIIYYPGYSLMSGLYADAQEEADTVRTVLRNRERAGDMEARAFLGHADELLERRFAGERVVCQLASLSEIIRQQGVERIDLLKVDVQKSELDLLEGIEGRDWDRIRQVVLEVHDVGGRLARVKELLSGRGFDVVVEQEAMLEGTDRHHLYASRDRGRRRSSPPRPFAPPELVTEADLRAMVADRLPEAMHPGAYVFVEHLPLTENGKLDRARLPWPEDSGRAREAAYVAPRTPVERELARLWSELLRVERVGIHDDFFRWGGHSLLAMQLVSRVRSAFRVELPLRELFQTPTIAKLAETIARA